MTERKGHAIWVNTGALPEVSARSTGTEKGPCHTGTPNVTSPWCANSKPRPGSSSKAWTGLIQSSQPGYRRSPDRIDLMSAIPARSHLDRRDEIQNELKNP